MRSFYSIIVVVVLIALGACRSDKATKFESSVEAVEAVSEKDSTLYGKVIDDFGMSSFAVQLHSGEECELLRSHRDGGEADIEGDVRIGDEFALTTTDEGEALDKAINVTQLKALVKDYKIINGKLVMHPSSAPDTVTILLLNGDSLVAKGKEQTYKIGK